MQPPGVDREHAPDLEHALDKASLQLANGEQQALLASSAIGGQTFARHPVPGRGNTLRQLCLSAWDSGLCCVGIASISSSLGALIVKLLDGRVPLFEIVVVRSLLCWAATDIVGRSQCIRPLYGSPKRYRILTLRGFAGAISMCLYYEAFERLMLSEAMTLYFVYPAITVVMAWVLLGESATWLALLGCAVSLAGVACIAKPPILFGGRMHFNLDHWLGVGAALACAFSGSIAMICVRYIGRSEATVTLALWFHVLAVVTFILPLAVGYPTPPVVPTLWEWSCLGGISLVSFVNQITLNRGFQLESAAKASAMNYTQVFWAHVWGVSFLHERETWTGVAGSLLLLGGVVTVSSTKAKPPDAGPNESIALGTSTQSKASDITDSGQIMDNKLSGGQVRWQDLEAGEEAEDELAIEMTADHNVNDGMVTVSAST